MDRWTERQAGRQKVKMKKKMNIERRKQQVKRTGIIKTVNIFKQKMAVSHQNMLVYEKHIHLYGVRGV